MERIPEEVSVNPDEVPENPDGRDMSNNDYLSENSTDEETHRYSPNVIIDNIEGPMLPPSYTSRSSGHGLGPSTTSRLDREVPNKGRTPKCGLCFDSISLGMSYVTLYNPSYGLPPVDGDSKADVPESQAGEAAKPSDPGAPPETTKDSEKPGSDSRAEEDEKPPGPEMPPKKRIPFKGHYLSHIWVLWYYENTKGKKYEESLREMLSFDAVECFWSVYHQIKLPSQLRVGCNYALFKDGIPPMWEDERNKNGGRWIVLLRKGGRTDKYWLETLLCLIGGGFGKYDKYVCGAFVNIGADQDRICVWTTDISHTKSIDNIGKKLKERLKLESTIGYYPHSQRSDERMFRYSAQ